MGIDCADRTAYDILGRLVVHGDMTPMTTTDNPQVAAGYTFDPNPTITAVSTAAVITDCNYDPLGRLQIQSDYLLPFPLAGKVGLSGPGEVLPLASCDYTVRADANQTSSIETFWLDENADGELTAIHDL